MGKKLKTHRGAKKRFKITATGKVMVKSSGKRHLLSSKTRKRKRQKGFNVLNKVDAKVISRLMPYG